jgi:hypothetical protein
LQATVWESTCAAAEVASKRATLEGIPALEHAAGVLVALGRGRDEPRGGRMTTWIVLRAAGIGAYVVLFASVAFGW